MMGNENATQETYSPREPAPDGPPVADDEMGPRQRGRLAAIWETVGAVVGAVMGVVPHVLHHVGLLAGAALVTGAGGNALFFAVGLLFSVPLLRRLYRKFGTWRAPAVAIAIFAAMFSLSAFVIGPALTGSGTSEGPPTPTPAPTQVHDGHHPK